MPLVSAPARDPVREQVVALRQRNLSVYDIQRELAAGRHPIGINALTILLREEGFARLPRRRDEERPAALKADSAGVADVRRLDPRLRVRSGCRRARFAPPSPACTFRTPRVFDEYVASRTTSRSPSGYRLMARRIGTEYERAHNSYLAASGLTDQPTPMPWFGNKRLFIRFARFCR